MKILYVTTVGKTMRFFEPFIKELIGGGHSVEIASNEINSPIPDCFREWGCGVHQISFSRSPLSPDNLRAFGQLKSVIEQGNYDIVHCHTPNASVITRLVCRNYRRKNGLKVFYTAHGFHFYKGAPLKNWLLYYPVEKFCSLFTDNLITINTEDYTLAKSKFHTKEIHYVPGVGVDLSRFTDVQVDREAKRREIGVPEDAFLLLSVGELNENKNHQVIIRALAELKDPDVHYAIAGVGEKRDELLNLANELGVGEQVHLLGYRKDIPELNHTADVFCFPSYREGLSVSLMEVMASGLPVVCSKIRGNTDLIDENGGIYFDPYSVDDCLRAIRNIQNQDRKMMGEYNKLRSLEYSVERITAEMKNIYEG